jgi:hypothetical protein
MRTDGLTAVSLVFASLLFGICASAQSTGSPKPSGPKPSQQNLYSNAWDAAEIKHCATHSEQMTLLICDDSDIQWPRSVVNLLGDYVEAGSSKEEATKQAILFTLTHSKTYLVKFSKKPWPSARPKPDDPGTRPVIDRSISVQRLRRPTPTR